ncbi:MAG: hypothetical protein DRJ47_05515 [Thermoprotei archaeon]|nr:MAG: hypothetical protein DRJ47_05515 [Thermoprotei archaeon]
MSIAYIKQLNKLEKTIDEFYKDIEEKRRKLLSYAYTFAENLARKLRTITDQMIMEEKEKSQERIEMYKKEIARKTEKKIKELKKKAEENKEKAIEEVLRLIIPQVSKGRV